MALCYVVRCVARVPSSSNLHTHTEQRTPPKLRHKTRRRALLAPSISVCVLYSQSPSPAPAVQVTSEPSQANVRPCCCFRSCCVSVLLLFFCIGTRHSSPHAFLVIFLRTVEGEGRKEGRKEERSRRRRRKRSSRRSRRKKQEEKEEEEEKKKKKKEKKEEKE